MMAHVTSFRSIGVQTAFDLEVDTDDHQFYLANGLLTSNSHAVAYAMDSYQCAFLMAYYPNEWLCSYIETMIGDPDNRAKAMSEIKSLGYSIEKIDINRAMTQWISLPKKRLMPSFFTVKGVGEAAIEEIMRNRPFKNASDLLWHSDGTWKPTKCNKRVFENLIKIGAFDSMSIVGDGMTFDNYKHMHHVIIENWDTIKHKKNGRKSFDDLLLSTRGMQDWTKHEKVEFLSEFFGNVNVDDVVPVELQKVLSSKNIRPINAFVDDDAAKKELVWFVVMSSQIKQTRNKRDYAALSAMGDDGKLFNVFCWDIKSGSRINDFATFVAEVDKSDFGVSTKSFKLNEVST